MSAVASASLQHPQGQKDHHSCDLLEFKECACRFPGSNAEGLFTRTCRLCPNKMCLSHFKQSSAECASLMGSDSSSSSSDEEMSSLSLAIMCTEYSVSHSYRPEISLNLSI
jgi:hypothetical protein